MHFQVLKKRVGMPCLQLCYFQFSVISDGGSSFHRGSFCWFLFCFVAIVNFVDNVYCVLQLTVQVGEKSTQAVLFKGVFKRNSSPVKITPLTRCNTNSTTVPV